jgi:hypothetical protein
VGRKKRKVRQLPVCIRRNNTKALTNDGKKEWDEQQHFSNVLLTKFGLFPNISKEQIKGKQSLFD